MSAKLKIDGAEYELPRLDDITLDEAIVLEQYARMTLSQIQQLDGDIPIGALKGLAVIGIQRSRPDASEAEIAKAVGGLKLAAMRENFEVDRDEDGDPLPPPNAGSSSSGDDDSREPSGENSNSDGERSPESELDPNPSGTQGSADSLSDRATSVA